MSYPVIATFVILIASIFGFTRSKLRSDWVAVMAMSALIVTGVLTPTEAILGFSNEATITVACMFAISAAFVKSGFVTLIIYQLSKYLYLGTTILTLALMIITAVFSSFLNNTAIVAIFIPVALKIAKELQVDKRRILMPLSFAAIVGGTCTLVGTSTNILVNSIYKRSGYDGFRMFDFSIIGILLSVGVIAYLMIVGLRLLTKKSSEKVVFEEEYLTVLYIDEKFDEIGVPYEDSKLLMQLGDKIINLKQDNILYKRLSGRTIQIGDNIKLESTIEQLKLLKANKDLSFMSENSKDHIDPAMDLFEVMVPKQSPVVGKTIDTLLHFRGHNFVPIGIKKSEAFPFHIVKDSILTPGDMLVLAMEKDSEERLERELNLKSIRYHKNVSIKPKLLAIVAIVIAGFMFTTALGIFTALQASIIATAALLLTRSLSLSEMYESLDSQVLMLLASILSLGLALEKTGVAKIIASFLVSMTAGHEPYILVGTLFLLTSMLTEIISNNATAALLAPIAISISKSMSVSEKPLLLAIMIGASMSFMSPIGYQTNTMIFSAGGFKFMDFLRVGSLLNLFVAIVGTFLILQFFPL